MKTKLKSIIAAALALAMSFIIGSAWAADPIAMWNSDFNLANKSGVTMTLNNNTINADGTISMAQAATKGVFFKLDSGSYANSTVIFEVEGMTIPAADGAAVVDTYNSSSGYADLAGIRIKENGDTWGIWNNNRWGTTPNQHRVITAEELASPTRVALTYSTGGGTYAYMTINGTLTQIFGAGGLKGGSTPAMGWTLLGPNSSTALSVMKGAKLKRVAFFDSVLSQPDITNYKFPQGVSIGDSVTFGNTGFSGTNNGAGNWTLNGLTVQPTAMAPVGTKVKIKNISFIHQSGRGIGESANTIVVGGITSNPVNGDGTSIPAWCNGLKVSYAFDDTTGYPEAVVGVPLTATAPHTMRLLVRTVSGDAVPEDSYNSFTVVNGSTSYHPFTQIDTEIIAPAPSPVVVWNHDFNNTSKNGYSLSLGNNAALADDNGVTVTGQTSGTGGTGVAIDWDPATFSSKTMTVLVKYSGLNQAESTGNTALVATYWGEPEKSKEILLDKTNKQVKLAYGVTSSASGSNGTAWTYSLPESGLLRVQYTSDGIRFTFLTGSDGNWTSSVDVSCTSVADLKKDAQFYGLKIGGTIALINHYYRPSMKVEAVAIFDDTLIDKQLSTYKFPTYKTYTYKQFLTTNFADTGWKFDLDALSSADISGKMSGSSIANRPAASNGYWVEPATSGQGDMKFQMQVYQYNGADDHYLKGVEVELKKGDNGNVWIRAVGTAYADPGATDPKGSVKLTNLTGAPATSDGAQGYGVCEVTICIESVSEVIKASATISEDVAWKDVEWDVVPTSEASVELTFSNSAKLTLDDTTAFMELAVVGNGSADQEITFAGPAASVATLIGATTFENFSGKLVYEFDATTGYTASTSLLSTIKDAEANVTFTFIGNGNNGATLDFNGASNNKTLYSHIVFNGGKHTLKHNQAQNNTFASGTTVENPAIFVTGGATLNFEGHDLTQWSGSYIAGGVIKVDNGATINMKNFGGTFFYRQQLCIVPGGTVEVPTGYAFEYHGGAASGVYEIYVPESAAGNTKVATVKGVRIREGESSTSLGVFVGANSILKIENLLDYKTSSSIVKSGAGMLELAGSIAPAVEIAAGSLSIADGVTVNNLTIDQATTVDVASGTATIGSLSGDYAITKTGAGALNLGTARTATVVGSSTGTIEFAITDDEKSTLEAGGTIAIVNISGDTFGGTVRIFDAAGTEYQIGDLAYSEGKIVIAKKADAKTPPFNLETAYVGNWTEAMWMDSTTPTAQEIGADDWNLKVGANISLENGTTTLTADRSLELGTLTINNAGALSIVNPNGKTVTVDVIDDGASTGTTTIGANITLMTDATAGKDTILPSTGSGTLTVGEGKKATVPGWNNTKVYGAGTLVINAATPETDVPWNTAPNFSGVMRLEQGVWTVTAGNNSAGYPRNSAVEIGPNGTLFITSATDATGYNGDLSKSLTVDGGTLKVGMRDTFSRTLNLKNGGKLLLTADKTNSNRAFDLFGNATINVEGETPCVIGGLTEGSTTDSGILAIRRSNLTVTVNEGATLKCYSQWSREDGSGFIKAGAGTWEQYRAANNTLGFTLQGGTLKLVNAGRVTNGTMTLNDNTTLELNATEDQTIGNTISGTGSILKTGAGATTLSGNVAGYTGAITVDAGTLVPSAGALSNTFTINESGAVEFTVDASKSGAVADKPTIALLAGQAAFTVALNGNQIRDNTEITIADVADGVTADNVTITLISADTGDEYEGVVSVDGAALKVKSTFKAAEHELTPTESGDFTWAAGSPFGESVFADYDNATFNTTEFATTVTVDGKVEAGELKLGGIYTFAGSPVIATVVSTLAGANATFNNDLVADEVTITNGTIATKSLVASKVSVENSTFGAEVMGPSMKFVRLTITATSGSGEKPAVGEFRLYRGNATTGYTIVDWPVGTKVSDTTGLTAIKETADYPAEVGAGLGNVGGNECQPGCLIDGYYGNKSSPKTYGNGAYNTPAYNKWWPTSASTYVVTIEFPYPVATFSGCNFCLADHPPRNPTAWTIEVSGDGINWTTVNETTGATWDAQYAWKGGDENVPGFLNADTIPTEVAVDGDTTIVADGSWTANLEVSGNLTLKGVAEKYLTLDAASSSSFAEGATLTFDLSAYEVTKAGKQYVIAGPTEGWPNTTAITVVPAGIYNVGKDDLGYYVEVVSGTTWIGESEGVGSWDLGKTLAWGNAEDDDAHVWLNGVAANFVTSGTATLADGVKPTAINLTATDEIAVELNGALGTLDDVPVAFGSADDTLILNTDVAFAPGAITEVEDAAGKLVKKGTGTLMLGANNTFTGGAVIEAGTVIFGGYDGSGAMGPLGPYLSNDTTDWTVDAVVKSGATLDINGQPDMVYVIELEEGATFKNGSTTGIPSNNRQTKMIKLSGNATVDATGMFGIHNGGNNATKLELGAYTLTKTGAGTFELVNTTVSGAGTFDVQAGTLLVNIGAVTMSDATLNMGAETTLTLNQALTTKNLALAGMVGGEAMLAVSGELSGTGTIPNLTLGDGATLASTSFTATSVSFGGALNLPAGTQVDDEILMVENEPTTLPTSVTIAGDEGYYALKYGEGKLTVVVRTVDVTIPEIANTTVAVTGGELKGEIATVPYGETLTVTYTLEADYIFSDGTTAAKVFAFENVTEAPEIDVSGIKTVKVSPVTPTTGDVKVYADETGKELVLAATGDGYTGDDVRLSQSIANYTEVKSVVIGAGVKRVGNRYFKDFTGLTTVKGGKDLVKFDEKAFYRCMSLEKIELENPEALESLKDAVVYQMAINEEGEFFMIPSIQVSGYVEKLYGKQSLDTKVDDWTEIGLLSGQNLEELKAGGVYHFFQTRFEKTATAE